MNRNLTILLLLSLSLAPMSALAILPYCGAAIPVGQSAGAWSPGYCVGLESNINNRHGLDWSALFSFTRVAPNAVNLLRTDGRELKVEAARGWSVSVEASILAGKTLCESKNKSWDFRTFGGAGIFYLQDADVYVGGFQPVGSSAVNRQRHIDGQTLIAPGVTLGLAGQIYGGIEPMVRIQHIFAGESARDYMMVGINLRPSK